MGYAADTARHGREVLDALRENSYDVVFMDVQMPVINGIEATQRIRRRTVFVQPTDGVSHHVNRRCVIVRDVGRSLKWCFRAKVAGNGRDF